MRPTEAESTGGPRPQRRLRYRRQLRSRIILSFVLLGFGLTALFAFATNWTRNRVEEQLIVDLMSRNIDEYARQFELDPENPQFPVDQIRAFVYTPDRFDSVRINRPEWYELPDGIHNVSGTDEEG
ncbi:two-component sensor histidine kinase, partial [Lysobacter sp. D1-1-M9]